MRYRKMFWLNISTRIIRTSFLLSGASDHYEELELPDRRTPTIPVVTCRTSRSRAALWRVAVDWLVGSLPPVFAANLLQQIGYAIINNAALEREIQQNYRNDK